MHFDIYFKSIYNDVTNSKSKITFFFIDDSTCETTAIR